MPYIFCKDGDSLDNLCAKQYSAQGELLSSIINHVISHPNNYDLVFYNYLLTAGTKIFMPDELPSDLHASSTTQQEQVRLWE